MTPQRDVLLLIDDDPEVRAHLRDNLFDPAAYHVIEAADGPDGLLKLHQEAPDLILLDLHLTGLSGRDMLVALKAQGYRGPLVVLADSGSEKDIVEAFRLGATDYLTRPLREAEVLATVERGLADVRLRRQHATMVARITTAEGQIEARDDELDRLYRVGQLAASLRDQDELAGHVLDTALALGHADYALLLLRDDANSRLTLVAGRNMDLSLTDRVGQPMQDPLADLVMTSREPLTMAGESLRRFGLPRDVRAVVYLPLVVQSSAIGVLAAGSRTNEDAFDGHRVRLLSVLADYLAIGVINARLFAMVKGRTRALETATRDWQARFTERQRELQAVRSSLTVVEAELTRLAHGKAGHLPPRAQERLLDLSQQVKQLLVTLSHVSQLPQ